MAALLASAAVRLPSSLHLDAFTSAACRYCAYFNCKKIQPNVGFLLSMSLRLGMYFEYCVPSFHPHLRSIVGGFLFISWTQLSCTSLT